MIDAPYAALLLRNSVEHVTSKKSTYLTSTEGEIRKRSVVSGRVMGVITVGAEYGIQNSSCPQPFVNNKSLFSSAKHLSISRAANGELRARYVHDTLPRERERQHRTSTSGWRLSPSY